MKYVVGIVPGAALGAVTEALGRAEIYRLTVSEVEVVDFAFAESDPAAQGDSREVSSSEDGHRLRLEIAVNDDFLQPAIDAFRTAEAATSDLGFGPFWVSVLSLENTIRIRTGETDSGAI